MNTVIVMTGISGKQVPNSCASASPLRSNERKQCCTMLVIGQKGEKKNEVRYLQQIRSKKGDSHFSQKLF